MRYGEQIVATVQANGALAGLIMALVIVGGGVAFYRWQASLQPSQGVDEP